MCRKTKLGIAGVFIFALLAGAQPPTPTGARKVAKQLLDFFKTDSTTKPWLVGP
jgi:hypothetical protein